MPACFKANYPTTPIIIDCTELFIEMPSSFCAQSQTYSRDTALLMALLVLLLVECDIYVLSIWCHISDKKIAHECGLIHLLDSDDVVMTHRGFDMHHLLASKSVTMNILLFARKRAVGT